MANNSDDEMEFLEQMLAEGLSRIMADLEEEAGHGILLADNDGEIFYSSQQICDGKMRKLLRELPVIRETEYYYHKKAKWLLCQLGEKECRLIVAVADVAQEDIALLLKKICRRQLALKTYLDMQHQSQLQAEGFEKNLAETLVTSSANIHDIIGLHHIELKPGQYYGILLLETGAEEADLAGIAKAVFEICNRIESGRIFRPIVWQDVVVVIVPVLNAVSMKNSAYAATAKKMAGLWQTEIGGKSGVSIDCGIGRFYMLDSLHKSYIEAKIAMALPQLKGKRGTVQAFEELGVFSMIFSQDIASLKEYVRDTLGPVIAYDQAVKMQLIDTLRILLDNGFNWAKTAKEMFAHVNTIHYRYDKIEKMLSLDLSRGKDQGDVFAALKVWDVLNKTGLLGADFFPVTAK